MFQKLTHANYPSTPFHLREFIALMGHRFASSIDTAKAVSQQPLVPLHRPFCGSLGKLYPIFLNLNTSINKF